MVAGEAIDSIIEVAHIMPYCGPDSNPIENGLLLRVDIHRLFDQGLLTIYPHTRKICVNVSLNKTSYLIFNDKELILKSKFFARDDYLEYRWKTCLDE
jgi:predicted restriction endonuclease